MKSCGKFNKKIYIYVPVVALVLLIAAFFSYTAYLNNKYKNTRIIRLWGGPGNQLYQVAFGYALEKKTGMKVLYDTHIIDKELKLAKNNKKNRVWVRWYFDKFDVNAEKWNANFLEKRFIRKNKLLRLKWEDCNGKSYDYDENCFKKNIGIYMTQVLENAEYFKGYEKDIQKMFTTLSDKYKNELDERNLAMIKEMQSHKNSVVINIRLGDFLQYKRHNICNFDYYKKAMKVFDKMKDVHYYIFSDDIEGAKKYFKPDKPHTYVDINPLEKPYLNLILSSSAKHNIVSNSTFAIWAGMLNKNPNKIVVCPNRFYKDDGKINKTLLQTSLNIYPDDWIKINIDNDEAIEPKSVDTKMGRYFSD